MNEKNLAELIDIPMEREESAYTFYMDIYEKVEDEGVKDALKFLAEEEKRHKEFLINYKNGHYGQDALRLSDVVDYRIAEHLEEPTVKKGIELKDVYLAAAHRELKSYSFYMALAEIHHKGNVKEMLIKMANEELKHKEKVEYLYSNTAFPQTAGG